jgi:hypothetical protein
VVVESPVRARVGPITGYRDVRDQQWPDD